MRSERVQPSERQQDIWKIIENDRQTFLTWNKLAKKSKELRLDLSPQAIRYLIPPRVFELAENPEDIHVRILHHQKKKLNFFIVEQKSQPLTFAEKHVEIHLKGSTYTRSQKNHFLLEGDTEKKDVLKPHDFIFNRLQMLREGNAIIIDQYMDRPQLHGKGIAASFYQRLQAAVTVAGFHYILGYNNPNNINFFTEKLKRTPLSELPSETLNKEHILFDKYKKYPFKADRVTVTILQPKNQSTA